MTEKRRLETAAPAIKHRMVNRRIPLVFLAESPFSNGSRVESIAGYVAFSRQSSRCPYRQEMCTEAWAPHVMSANNNGYEFHETLVIEHSDFQLVLRGD